MGCGCWDLELFFYLDLCFPTASHEVSPGDPHQPSFTPTALLLGVLLPVIPPGGFVLGSWGWAEGGRIGCKKGWESGRWAAVLCSGFQIMTPDPFTTLK